MSRKRSRVEDVPVPPEAGPPFAMRKAKAETPPKDETLRAEVAAVVASAARIDAEIEALASERAVTRQHGRAPVRFMFSAPGSLAASGGFLVWRITSELPGGRVRDRRREGACAAFTGP